MRIRNTVYYNKKVNEYFLVGFRLRIRNYLYGSWIRIRTRILPSKSKTIRKKFDFSWFFYLLMSYL
jgi:hypothetical protein